MKRALKRTINHELTRPYKQMHEPNIHEIISDKGQ